MYEAFMEAPSGEQEPLIHWIRRLVFVYRTGNVLVRGALWALPAIVGFLTAIAALRGWFTTGDK